MTFAFENVYFLQCMPFLTALASLGTRSEATDQVHKVVRLPVFDALFSDQSDGSIRLDSHSAHHHEGIHTHTRANGQRIDDPTVTC